MNFNKGVNFSSLLLIQMVPDLYEHFKQIKNMHQKLRDSIKEQGGLGDVKFSKCVKAFWVSPD